MIKELEASQSKLIVRLENDNPKEVDETVGKFENIELNLATDIENERVEPNSEDNFCQENEIAVENNLLEFKIMNKLKMNKLK